MADDVVALLDAEGLGQVVVGGSVDGRVRAMALLRRAPERVAALVLADTKATADTDDARAGRLAMAQRMDSGGATASLAEGMIPALLGETTCRDRPEVVGDRERLDRVGCAGFRGVGAASDGCAAGVARRPAAFDGRRWWCGGRRTSCSAPARSRTSCSTRSTTSSWRFSREPVT